MVVSVVDNFLAKWVEIVVRTFFIQRKTANFGKTLEDDFSVLKYSIFCLRLCTV